MSGPEKHRSRYERRFDLFVHAKFQRGFLGSLMHRRPLRPIPPGPGIGAGTPALSYSPERHGTHAAFFQGPDFPQYKEEVRANLSFLADYCRQHQVSDADAIAGQPAGVLRPPLRRPSLFQHAYRTRRFDRQAVTGPVLLDDTSREHRPGGEENRDPRSSDGHGAMRRRRGIQSGWRRAQAG